MPRPGRWMGWRLCVLAVLAATPGRAQDAIPDTAPPAMIEREFRRLLPDAWRLAELRLGDPVTMPTPDGPETRSRIHAALTLAVPTFDAVEREGGLTFVRPVAPAGFRRTLSGTATARPRPGGWESRIVLDDPAALAPPGTPLEAMPGRAIILGSNEDTRLRADRAAEAASRHAAALAGLRRAAALAAERQAVEAAALEARRLAEDAAAVAAIRHDAALAAARLEARQAADRQAEAARQEDAEARTVATAREAAAQVAQQRAQLEGRATQLALLRAGFTAGDRSSRIAAFDQAMRSEDPAIRTLGFETAFAAPDATILTLALRRYLQQKRDLQVGVFAPSSVAQGQVDPRAVIASVAGFSITVRRLDPATGDITGEARFGGNVATVSGTAGRNEVTFAFRPAEAGRPFDVGGFEQKACSLSLRLSDVQTLDGLFGCTSSYTPRLIARIALD